MVTGWIAQRGRTITCTLRAELVGRILWDELQNKKKQKKGFNNDKDNRRNKYIYIIKKKKTNDDD